MNKFTQKAIAVMIGLVFLLSPCLSQAIASGTSGIMPAYPDPENPITKSWFIYNLKPGESKEDAAKLMNNSDEYVTFKLYPVDALTTLEGNFALANEDEPKIDIGAWIKLSTDQVTVPPHKEMLVPFTITIPNENVETGDHIGGLIIEQVKSDEGQQKGLFIKTRIGVRIYETVPGEIIKKLTIKEFYWQLFKKPVKAETGLNWLGKIFYFIKNKVKLILGLDNYIIFFVKMGNDGNVRLEPEGNLIIRNILGSEVARLEPKMNTIFPRKEILYPAKWERKMPFFGRYTASIEVKYNNTDTAPSASQKITIWAIPYLLLGGIVVLIVLIILLRLLLLLLMETRKKKMAVHLVQEDETLESLAADYGLSWKKIAKFNRLKAPYQIKPKDKIIIPKKGLIITAKTVKQESRPEIKYDRHEHEIKLAAKITAKFGKLGKKKFHIILGSVILALIIIAGLIVVFKGSEPNANLTLQPTTKEEKKVEESKKEPVNDSATRDRQRKEDLKLIKEALAKYKQEKGQYPINETIISTGDKDNLLVRELSSRGYLATLPIDPLDSTQGVTYYYGYQSKDGKTFELSCLLENINDTEGKKLGEYLIYTLKP